VSDFKYPKQTVEGTQLRVCANYHNKGGDKRRKLKRIYTGGTITGRGTNPADANRRVEKKMSIGLKKGNFTSKNIHLQSVDIGTPNTYAR